MHKRRPYKCPVCGAEVPDLPMPVLQHQMSHAKPRPYVGVRANNRPADREVPEPPKPDDATAHE